MNAPVYGAIILAAGLGSRMGAVKPLVEFGGATFLARVAAAIRAADVVRDIRVVTGASGDVVGCEAARLGLEAVHNHEFAGGIMGSLQIGLRAILAAEAAGSPRYDGVLVALADQPFVRESSLRTLVEAFTAARARGVSLARPVCEGREGNPCVIGREHFDELLAQPAGDRGAAFLFRAYPTAALFHLVDDPGVTLDLDEPADVESARSLYA